MKYEHLLKTVDKLCSEKGISRNAAFNESGVGKDFASNLMKGSEPSMKKIQQLADYFNVKTDYLLGNDKGLDELFQKYDNIKPIRLKKFPMLGEIACGEPIFAEEQRETCIMADMDIDADFCLTAKGDSMKNARIKDGDIVFIKQMPMVRNGDIAAVIINDEATLKRVYYYPDKNKLVLNPENPEFEPLVYTDEELNEIRILGKAVYFMSAL